MRLTDLDPHWMSDGSLGADGQPRHGMGITFECPCCVGSSHRLGVYFENPLDGGPHAPPDVRPKPRWTRTGETFEALTLTPSIDASKTGPCAKCGHDMPAPTCSDVNCRGPVKGHWHGFITNGEIR